MTHNLAAPRHSALAPWRQWFIRSVSTSTRPHPGRRLMPGRRHRGGIPARGLTRHDALAPIALALCLAGGLAGTARAADTVIGFEDSFATPGATITDQYAAQGVTFYGQPDPTGGLLPVFAQVDPSLDQDPSGTRVANISHCFPCETFTPDVTGRFSQTHTHVGVYVGEFPTAQPDTAQLTLTAYDANHNVIARSTPVTVTAGAGFHTPLSVSSPTATIISFEVSGSGPSVQQNQQLGIDDLSFDIPATPHQPDFTISSPSGTTVPQGGTSTVPITINRLNQSAGDVSLDIAGLPPGVTATFVPNPTSGTASTLTLTAATDAPRSPATATITGSPAALSVGPTTRSTPLAIVVDENFNVALGGTPDADLSMCTASVPIIVTRNLLFSDPVTLSVAGLPAGVTGTITPNILTFGSGNAQQTAQLVLQAAPTGIAIPPTPVTVSAASPIFRA